MSEGDDVIIQYGSPSTYFDSLFSGSQIEIFLAPRCLNQREISFKFEAEQLE